MTTTRPDRGRSDAGAASPLKTALPLSSPDDGYVASAESAGLVYVSDAWPGIRRERQGAGFQYLAPDGSAMEDASVLEWIGHLAIPPAWEDVWISPLPDGHIQATGRDAKGRKQYLYHEEWRKARDETKYERMVAFARLLPQLRKRVEKDLSRPGLTRQQVLATVVRLLELSLIRVGNREYERANRTYGLTTLHRDHVDISGSELRFEFVGKRGVRHNVGVRDRRLARIVSELQELPGQKLFHYIDENGESQQVDSAEVNDYIREAMGEDFTAKDFRTFAGTVTAATALRDLCPAQSQAQAKRHIAKALDIVASRLRNTRAVSRKSYVLPVVLEAYQDGSLLEYLSAEAPSQRIDGLRPEEAAVVHFIESRSAGRATD